MSKIKSEKAKQLVMEQAVELMSVLQGTNENLEDFKVDFREVVNLMRLELYRLDSKGEYNVDESVIDNSVKKLSTDFKKKVDTLTKKQPTKSKKKEEVIELNPKWEEEILVVEREKLFENEELTFQGTLTDEEQVLRIMGNVANNFKVMRRGATTDSTPRENNAEINTEFKQPIPYAMITRGNEVYVYERLSQGGESRLHNKLSIGVGGHMNLISEDATWHETLVENLTRELDEELHIESTKKDIEYLGLINDDEDEVGAVHLGILARIEVDADAVVEVKETDQLKGQWVTIDELRTNEVFDRLESWSKISVENL